MKSIIQKDKKKEPLPFPKLMISNKDMVVLFDSYGQGIVVHQGSGGSKLYLYQKTFNMELFTDYYGKVILSND